MEKFIESLDGIISKNCYFDGKDDFYELFNENLLFGFGLLRLLDLGLKYSKKNSRIIVADSVELSCSKDITVVKEEQDLQDKAIYIDNIFSLTDLYYFDAGIINYFNKRASPFYEMVFSNNVSFLYESRLEILCSMIKCNNDFYNYILKRYPKDKLKNSNEMQNEFFGSIPEAFLTEEDIYLFFSEYIACFVDSLKLLFDSFDFLELVSILKEKFVLSDLLNDLSNINISKENFLTTEKFSETLDIFISSFKEKYCVVDKQDCLRELLVDLLFADLNLEDYTNINIYDPFYFSTDTLEKSEEYVLNKNNKCNVNLCKKEGFKYLFNKKINLNNDFYKMIATLFYNLLKSKEKTSLQNEDYGIPYDDINTSDLDFIISDYRYKSISEDIGFIHQFQYELDYSSKLAIIIKKSELYNKTMNWMIKNDNLEALIVFEDCFILIANSNKSMKRRNKFILIDYELFLNYEVPDIGIIEIPIEVKRQMKPEILRIYKEFIDTPFSKVINNEEVIKDFVYDELDKYWGNYYNNPLEKLINIYPLVPNDFSGWFSEELKNIPNDVLLKSKQYHEQIIIQNFNFNKHFMLLYNINPNTDRIVSKNIDFYTKDFNYKDLMYDKKIKIAPKIKQKSVEDGKSKIFEEKVDYVPLHSIITFNSKEIDETKISERTIEKYDNLFFVNSEKFLKKFLEIYLISGRAQEDYNYFLKSDIEREIIFISKSKFNFKKDFIYIRVPLIDIETQEKIIKAYELNEEHYNLVKQSRDNFRKDILDYEKVLKDMEEFNTMEIDTKTGQIVRMSTVKRHMFDGLLWPLSISYLNAVHGTHVSNPNEKLDFYLKLFEFLTAFIDIILISSIPEEYYKDFKYELWEGISENNFYEATFGTWTKIYSKLLEFYSENSINPKFNNDLIESLLDEGIYKIMDEAREIRNEFPGHGTSIHESRAKQLIDDLKLKIDVVYEIFGYLTGFKLFYSVKVLELFEDGSNLYEVVSLNGPCDQPIYGEVTFKKRLKNNSLYLNNSIDGDLLELDENLIIFEEVVEDYKDKKGQKKQRATGRFYLYLFNGFKKKKNKVQMRYKCYQIETDEIRKNVSFDEWKKFI